MKKLLFLSVFLAACGGGGGGDSANSVVNFEGTWAGRLSLRQANCGNLPPTEDLVHVVLQDQEEITVVGFRDSSDCSFISSSGFACFADMPVAEAPQCTVSSVLTYELVGTDRAEVGDTLVVSCPGESDCALEYFGTMQRQQ